MPENAPGPSRGYRFARAVARLLLRIEYRRVEVSGADRVPAAGALVLVANHHHSLVDSMAILAASPRPAGPMAKAPLFRDRFLRPFLNAVAAVPVYRPQDAGENEGRGARANLDTFAECIRRLRAGGSIVLFPEGMSRLSPRLMPLRTGAARIALDAETPVNVMPVGLSLEDRGERRGTVLVRFGEPFVVDGREEGGSRHSRVAAVTRRIEAAIRALLAEADSIADLALMRTAAAALASDEGKADEPLSARQRRVQDLADGYEALRRVDPAERTAIRDEADAFANRLASLSLPPDALDRRYGFARVSKFLLSTLVRVAIGAPLAVVATVVTGPARWTGDLLVLRGGHVEEDVRPFSRIFARAMFVTIEAVLAGLLVGLLISPLAGVAALVAIPALFAFHVVWRDWRADVASRVRAFLLLAGGQLRRDLLGQRRALAQRVDRAGKRIASATTVSTAP